MVHRQQSEVKVKPFTPFDSMTLLRDSNISDEDYNKLADLIGRSAMVNIGLYAKELVCVWGMIPITLLSDRAYIWLYHTENIAEHQFLFIRHSQIWVKQQLEVYAELYGVTDPKAKKTVRWLKWLGAEFEPSGEFLDFKIRKN